MNDFEKVKQLYKENKINEINEIINSNTIEDNNKLLVSSAKNGHLDIVKLLLSHSDPKAKNSYALRLAAEKGYTKIVTLLITYPLF